MQHRDPLDVFALVFALMLGVWGCFYLLDALLGFLDGQFPGAIIPLVAGYLLLGVCLFLCRTVWQDNKKSADKPLCRRQRF